MNFKVFFTLYSYSVACYSISCLVPWEGSKAGLGVIDANIGLKPPVWFLAALVFVGLAPSIGQTNKSMLFVIL